MRIPISDEEVGLVKVYLNQYNYYRIYDGDYSIKHGGRLMTWAQFREQFPIRGYHLCTRYKKLKDKYY